MRSSLFKRSQFTYHAKSYARCILQSVILFYVLSTITPMLNFGVIYPVIVGAVGIFVLSWEVYNFIPKPDLDSLSPSEIETLIDACQLSDEDARFARLVWIDRLTIAKLENKLNYGETWIKKKKKHLKEQLLKRL